MKLYGDQPIQKAMGDLIHDHNMWSSKVNVNKELLSIWLKENVKKAENAGISTSKLYYIVESLKETKDQLNFTLDRFVKAFQEYEPNTESK